MEQKTLSEFDSLRLIYQEIIEGCSISKDGTIFLKHLTDIDNIEVLRQRIVFLNYYLSKGIPSESTRLKELIESSEWSLEKEDQILSLRYSISDNEHNLRNIIPQQQASIKYGIEMDKKKLISLLTERHLTFGTTAEEMSNRDSSNFFGFFSAYKDRKLTIPFFKNWEEFDELDNDEHDKFQVLVNENYEKFSDKNIKGLACLPIFLNAFSYCKEDLVSFLNKPIALLSSNQLHLFSLGERNLNILSKTKASPPELLDDIKISDIVSWYDLQYSVILGKRNG